MPQRRENQMAVKFALFGKAHPSLIQTLTFYILDEIRKRLIGELENLPFTRPNIESHLLQKGSHYVAGQSSLFQIDRYLFLR